MPRFSITAEFSLCTTIECEVSRYEWDASGVTDFEDNSYWDTNDVDCSGGSLTFVVEADDEGDAESKAGEIIFDGQEVTDSNDLTWNVDSLNFTVEEISEPMTLERAKEILIKVAEGIEDPDVAEALDFVLDHLDNLTARLTEASERIDGLVNRVTEADLRITALSARLQETETPTQIGGAADRLERFVATDDTSVLTEGLPES